MLSPQLAYDFTKVFVVVPCRVLSRRPVIERLLGWKRYAVSISTGRIGAGRLEDAVVAVEGTLKTHLAIRVISGRLVSIVVSGSGRWVGMVEMRGSCRIWRKRALEAVHVSDQAPVPQLVAVVARWRSRYKVRHVCIHVGIAQRTQEAHVLNVSVSIGVDVGKTWIDGQGRAGYLRGTSDKSVSSRDSFVEPRGSIKHLSGCWRRRHLPKVQMLLVLSLADCA